MNGMPQPTAQHKKLERLAGRWVAEERMNPSPWGPGGTATGRMSAHMDIDGFFLIQDYLQEKDGRVSYRGHGILSWDTQQQTYTWYWVDSMGFVPPAPSRGSWEGDTLILEQPPMGDRRGRYTHVVGDDSYTFKIESSNDAGKSWVTFMEGTYRRG